MRGGGDGGDAAVGEELRHYFAGDVDVEDGQGVVEGGVGGEGRVVHHYGGDGEIEGAEGGGGGLADEDGFAD